MSHSIGTADDNLQLLCSAATAEATQTLRQPPPPYHQLVIRQQPERSRVGSISEKMDRRPIDPPPVIQLIVCDPLNPQSRQYTVSPAFFMQVILLDEEGKNALHHIKGSRVSAMAGTMVSPLHTLRDMTDTQGAYFVFSDLSVRMEGSFRLRFDLFEIEGGAVYNRVSVTSENFFVYSPKRFPGMMESTQLSKLFAEQGLRIRIRTEAGTKKRGKKALQTEPPSKRARVTAENCTQSAVWQPQRIDNICAPRCPGAHVSSASPMPSLAHGIINPSGHANSGLLIFQHEPFPTYDNINEENKENIPVRVQNNTHLDNILGLSTDHRPQDKRPHEHTYYQGGRATRDIKYENRLDLGLDFDDIAAVALLDSLSNGASRQPPMSSGPSSDLMQLLGSTSYGTGHASFPTNSSSINCSPLDALAPAKPVQRFSSLPTKPTDIFGAILSPSGNMGLPLSNYRLSALRSPEFREGIQLQTENTGTFFDSGSRFHPSLRSSNSNSRSAALNEHPSRIIRTSCEPWNDSLSTLGVQLPQVSHMATSSQGFAKTFL
ncbi:hypothetical protein H4R24_002381 [Coemansia sp. RSA 988]|nr:hypothetical protein H4R24_002381 [Coemansia sp. RSA 988]